MTVDNPRRIVIAEDEPASRVLLTRQLQKGGFAVVPCADGLEALEAIQREGGGLLVADWMMPRMDGLELCKAVRGLCDQNALGLVYMILLTANSEKEMIVQGLEAGADDYLTKPYHLQELLARIRGGRRILDLQDDLLRKSQELQRINADMGVLNQKLERLANSDGLTGLANRRFLLERFQEAWAFSVRKERPLSCIMLDVDRFKSINDTYGHAAGDEVLKAVAHTCRNCTREYDHCGRLGGEEFCVVIPDGDLQAAGALGERIRAAISGLQLFHEEKPIPVTISGGVSTRGNHHDGVQQLLADADAMLYRAKQNGRNQIWLMDEMRTPRKLEVASAGLT